MPLAISPIDRLRGVLDFFWGCLPTRFRFVIELHSALTSHAEIVGNIHPDDKQSNHLMTHDLS